MSKLYTGLAASFDLECTPGLDPVWSRLLCGVVKPWKQDAKVFRLSRASANDSGLVKVLVEELSHYAILFAHNGLWFDRAFLNGRALHYNLPTLDIAGKIVDPYQLARKHLNTKKNSLDALAAHFNLSKQKMHISPEVWVRASLDHDEEAMLELIERCKSDCEVLEELAQRLLSVVGNITPWGSA